jgi:acyl-CoA synthetase (AMP-forming)/AMP-acid ligase II
VLEGIDVRIIKISDEPIEKWSDSLVVSSNEIGEITVGGDLVTRNYFNNPRADELSKIKGDEKIWHRMGDLGWMDKKGRIWFCGRKNHRVVAESGTFFTIPCEAIFNNHPRVFRSALVGAGNPPEQKPVICIELEPGSKKCNKKKLRQELFEIAQNSPLTKDIDKILFKKAFPVDIRHNSKIFREKLKLWAEKKVN